MKLLITIIILCLTLTGVAGLAAAGANAVNASSVENRTVIGNMSGAECADNLSDSEYIGELTWDWKGYYAQNEEGWISIVDPQIGKSSMKIVAVRSGYNGIVTDLHESPLNLSEKCFAVCVKSSDWNKLKEANLVMSGEDNFSDVYVFDIKDYFHNRLPDDGEWTKIVMRPDKFKTRGNPDGTNITHILFQIKGEKCADLYVDGFGYSQLPQKNVSNATQAIRPIAGQNVSNASNVTANQSVAPVHGHHRHHEEENHARIVSPSDKMEAQFNITSPSGTVVRSNNVTLLVAGNLTSSEAKHLALQYEWNITREGAPYSAIEGNNKTIGLPNGNYTANVTIGDKFGRTESLEHTFAVENISAVVPGITPASNVTVATPNFTITPSPPPAVESGGGRGNLWQLAVTGIQFNTSNFSLSNFHVGSIFWWRAETFNASVWEDYRSGKEDLRRKYLLNLPSEEKIAYVITFIHGDGGKEISGDFISAG